MFDSIVSEIVLLNLLATYSATPRADFWGFIATDPEGFDPCWGCSWGLMIPKYFKWLWLQENGKEFSSYIAIEGAQTLKTEAAGADDSINSMNQDKTHDTISGSAAHGCQRCMNEEVHDCEEDMDLKPKVCVVQRCEEKKRMAKVHSKVMMRRKKKRIHVMYQTII